MADSQRLSVGDTGYDPYSDPDSPQYGNPPTSSAPATRGPIQPLAPPTYTPPQRAVDPNWPGQPSTTVVPFNSPINGAVYSPTYDGPRPTNPDGTTMGAKPLATDPTTPTTPAAPDYTTPAGQLSAVTGWLQSGGFGGDDPNYWVGRINQTGGFTPGNLDYWQKRISAGPQGGQPGGAYYDPGALGQSNQDQVGGQNPLDPNAKNTLFNTLLDRSKQSLDVNPNDPIIKAQTNAHNATEDQQLRKYLSGLAEQKGPYGNQAAETRSANESVGQNNAGFQATLISNELQQRRTEIQDALTQMGGMLSGDQQLALQKQLALLDNALKQQQINSGNDQFAQTFNLTASDQAWYHDAVLRGLIPG